MSKIIFVEDNLEMLELLMRIAGKHFPECECSGAVSADEAMEMIPADVMFVDGFLVGSYGWDLASRLRDSGYDKPIYYFGNAFLPPEMGSLFDGFLRKDDMERLLDYIRRHV